MIRSHLLKWAAAAALACAVPAIGLARHTPTSAAAPAAPSALNVAAPMTTSTTSISRKHSVRHHTARHGKKHNLAARHKGKHKLSTSHKKSHKPI